jgi:hypothetical protein
MGQPRRELISDPGNCCFLPPDAAWRGDEVVPVPRLCFQPADLDAVLDDVTDDERALLRRVG